MKLFGHPVHPLMIHFPTALLPMDLVMTILFYKTGNPSFYEAGFYSLVGAAVIGIVAMLTGLVDLLNIPRSDKNAIAAGLYHSFLNGSIILVFAVIAFKAWQEFPSPYAAGLGGIVLKGILVALLFFGNYIGGNLIYRHHIGITKMD